MSEPGSTTGVVTIVVSDEQTDVDVDADRWADLASAVLQAEGRTGELTLTFVDRDEIAALNRQHLGHDGPTDVLSFPLDAGHDDVPGVPVLLGDIVVCPNVAAEQAGSHAGTLDDELALLVVHGVLHVLGHDHAEADETALMRTRERELLQLHHWRGDAPAGFHQDHAP
jgi:probable rRNA maturation factor